MTSRTPRDCAIHEAGHAVIAHVLGYKIQKVISPKSAAPHAMCELAPRAGRDREIEGRDRMCFCFAGIAANMRDVAGEWVGGEPEGWRSDRRMAAGIAHDLFPWEDESGESAAEKALEEEKERAAEEIDRCWPAVEALAWALEARQALPGDEVHAIIKNVLTHLH